MPICNPKAPIHTFPILGPLSLSSAVKETKVGSASIISVVCQQCDKENTIVTSGQHRYGKRGTLNVPTINKLHTKTESEQLARPLPAFMTQSPLRAIPIWRTQRVKMWGKKITPSKRRQNRLQKNWMLYFLPLLGKKYLELSKRFTKEQS